MQRLLDKPLSEWPDSLSAVQAGAELLRDDLMLEVVAHPDDAIEKRVAPNLRSVFARRLTDDFGLPALSACRNERDWRIEVLSRLLATDAAIKAPSNPPTDRDRIIREGSTREPSRKLLERWIEM